MMNDFNDLNDGDLVEVKFYNGTKIVGELTINSLGRTFIELTPGPKILVLDANGDLAHGIESVTAVPTSRAIKDLLGQLLRLHVGIVYADMSISRARNEVEINMHVDKYTQLSSEFSKAYDSFLEMVT